MLLLVLLAWAAACPAPPPPCSCGTSPRGRLEYRCATPEATFTVEAGVNDFAEVHCESGALTCAMPRLPVSSGVPLSALRVRARACSVAPACVLRALGAPAAARVSLAGVPVGEGVLDGLEGVERLDIDYTDAQSSLPLGALARLPSLRHVRVNGANLTLTPGPFPPNPYLSHLELVDCALASLPRGALGSLRNLTALSLMANRVEELDGGAFEGLDNLQTLDLTDNPLRELGAGLFRGTPRLAGLTLVGNSLQRVDSSALRGLQHFEEIFIHLGSEEIKLEESAFSHLPALKRVAILDTPLAALPEVLLEGSGSLVELEMSGCGLLTLPKRLFYDQNKLTSLNLKNNKLSELNKELFWRLKSLKVLDMSKNQLAVLPEDLFAGVTRLVTVRLDRNGLETILEGTFQNLEQLEELTLSHNQLTLLQGEQPGNVNRSPFMNLRLTRLDLSHNNIGVVFDDWRRTWVHEIRWIDLSWNKIRRLRAKDVQFQANVTVDLRHNEIYTVDIGPHLLDYPNTIFRLDKNPFRCDCNLYPFLNYTYHYKLPIFEIDKAYCNPDSSSESNSLDNVSLQSLTCIVTENCPTNCICSKRPAKSVVELDCTNMPEVKDFPEPLAYNLTVTKLRVRQSFQIVELPAHVVSLDLSNLSLTDVPEFPDSVTEIDLRFNNLVVIPEWLLERNVTMYLPNNTLNCDCRSKRSIEKLQSNRFKIHDFNNITCSDDRFLKTDLDGICYVFYATIVGSALAGLSLVILVIVILIYKYSEYIKETIYILGWDMFIYEEEIDKKEYDVLISYSDEYEKFVAQILVPKFENEGYSVCVRYRHWDIGDWIPAKVAQLIEKSRRVLVLLTKEYLSSIASLELQAGLMSERRGRRKRVLLVLTEDMVPDENVKNFLEKKKYLELKDSRFWSRLRSLLPRKREGRPVSRLTQKTLNVLMTADGNVLYSSKKSLNL